MAELDQALINTPLWNRINPYLPESSKPSDRCANPEIWTMMDEVAPEVEVLKLLRETAKTVKPTSMLVFGDLTGYTTLNLGQAARENGFGIVSVGGVPGTHQESFVQTIGGSGIERFVNVLLDENATIPGKAQLAFFDGSAPGATETFEAFIDLVEVGGIVFVHDANEPRVRELVPRNLSPVYYPTPRGLLVFQK